MRRILSLICAMVLCVGVNLEAKNQALLIGIGDYNTANTGWSIIHGNNDVSLLSGKLKVKGFNVATLTDKAATKANIQKALHNLETKVMSGDVVYIHFSGHGQLIADMNNDEQEDLDQSFVCYDACFSPNYKVSGKAYRGQNHLIDDELFPYINRIKGKVGSKGNVIVIFDSCYSGGADRSEMTDDPDPESEVEWTSTPRGTDDEFQVNRSTELYLRSIVRPGKYSRGGGGVTVISACESDQKNYECKEKHSGRKYGSLSYCISKLLDNNIPMTQWGEFFSSGKFRRFKIIRPSQKPAVEIHK